MKLLVIFAILCAFILMVAAVEDQQSADLAESTNALSADEIIDDEHVRVDRAARRHRKKARRAAKKGHKKARRGHKKARKPHRKGARKAHKKARKAHRRG